MFQAPRAHHQERQILSIQPLVTVTVCWWPCRVHTTWVTLVIYQESLQFLLYSCKLLDPCKHFICTSPSHFTPRVIKCELSIVVLGSVPRLKSVVDILVFLPNTFIFDPYQWAFYCYLATEGGWSPHCHNFICQFEASHFTWHVAGLELKKGFCAAYRRGVLGDSIS
jgi:hypothetical protein